MFPRGSNNDSQVLARAEQLPFPNNSFDVITSRGMFDFRVYNQNPELMMNEIHRVLKKGGIYVAVGSSQLIPPHPGLEADVDPHNYVVAYKKVSE